MKGKVEKKMGLFLLCCLCVDIMNVSSVYGAENGELFDHTSEVRTEESIEKGLPSGLELSIESKTLLVGDVLQIGIVAENALMIIPVLFEPPVRTLRATVPEKRSHIFR